MIRAVLSGREFCGSQIAQPLGACREAVGRDVGWRLLYYFRWCLDSLETLILRRDREVRREGENDTPSGEWRGTGILAFLGLLSLRLLENWRSPSWLMD